MKKLNIRYLMMCSLFLLLTLPVSIMAQDAGDPYDPYAPYDNGVPEGWKVIEGDILVRISEPEGTFESNLWSNRRVPYQFDSNVSSLNQTRAVNAMAELEAVSNIDFRPRNGEGNYVHFQNSTVNNSAVGMKGGRQVINIVSWSSRFIIVHECMHAAGFWHEQSRPDRDSFVTIHLDRIPSDKEHNFDKKSSADVLGTYDFDSVMHYDQCAFSECSNCSSNLSSCRTITVKSPNTSQQGVIGQRDHLSDLDQLTMQYLYPPSNWRFVNGSYSKAPPANFITFLQIGTFHLPAKTISKGVSVVPTGGTLIVMPGTYSGATTYSKAMTLRGSSLLGTVTIR
ncbi:MAG: M12 family metallopeptidase [Candidatus Scalindua sp.]|nr:M12 family metallopeptidase [Candidatus Scalindua sp.]